MLVPLRRLLFHVDNGASSHLEGTGLAAEYSLKSRAIVWRRQGGAQPDCSAEATQKFANYLWMVSPLFILPVLIYFGGEWQEEVSPIERFGLLGWFLPLILGILFFLSFEALMLQIRDTYPLVEAPPVAQQKRYFTAIYNITIRRNEAWSKVKTPYLATTLSLVFVCGLVTPLFYWSYLQETDSLSFIYLLIFSGFLISLIPNALWNILYKTIIYRKVMAPLRGEAGSDMAEGDN